MLVFQAAGDAGSYRPAPDCSADGSHGRLFHPIPNLKTVSKFRCFWESLPNNSRARSFEVLAFHGLNDRVRFHRWHTACWG